MAWGQGVWDDPFESTNRGFRNRAWTFSAGAEQLRPMGSSWASEWIIPREDLVNDTLHVGQWETTAPPSLLLGAGLVWRRPNALWLDRVSVSAQASRRKANERYMGLLKVQEGEDSSVVTVDDPLVHEGRAWVTALQIQGHSTLLSGPDRYVEWMTGIRAGVHLATSETPTVNNLFQSMSLPQWHVAWTLGLGAGLKVWRGRIVRVSLDVDALQLAKARQTWVPRARDAGLDGLDWMQGTYRPWRVSLHHDLFQPKPQEGCAAPTHSKASKTLFDPKMGKTGKVKHKGYKKFLNADN